MKHIIALSEQSLIGLFLTSLDEHGVESLTTSTNQESNQTTQNFREPSKNSKSDNTKSFDPFDPFDPFYSSFEEDFSMTSEPISSEAEILTSEPMCSASEPMSLVSEAEILTSEPMGSASEPMSLVPEPICSASEAEISAFEPMSLASKISILASEPPLTEEVDQLDLELNSMDDIFKKNREAHDSWLMLQVKHNIILTNEKESTEEISDAKKESLDIYTRLSIYYTEFDRTNQILLDFYTKKSPSMRSIIRLRHGFSKLTEEMKHIDRNEFYE